MFRSTWGEVSADSDGPVRVVSRPESVAQARCIALPGVDLADRTRNSEAYVARRTTALSSGPAKPRRAMAARVGGVRAWWDELGVNPGGGRVLSAEDLGMRITYLATSQSVRRAPPTATSPRRSA